MSSFHSFRGLRRPFAALSMLLVTAAVPGCFDVGDDDDDDDSGDSCEDDDDCRSTQFCNSDGECEREDSDPEPECRDEGECLSGELCSSEGECVGQCALLCDYFSRCSANPSANCVSSCSTVLGAPEPCATAFAFFIECVAEQGATCTNVSNNCQDEADIFGASCGVAAEE